MIYVLKVYRKQGWSQVILALIKALLSLLVIKRLALITNIKLTN